MSTFNEMMKETLAKWFSNKEAKTDEVAAPTAPEAVAPAKAEVEMSKETNVEAAVPDANATRFDALEEAVKAIVDKINAAPEPTAMSAIEALKTELAATKADLAKFSAAPSGQKANDVINKKTATPDPMENHAGLRKLISK